MEKNIVFVIPSLEYGGAETMLIQQLNYLDEIGYDVSLIVLSKHIVPDLLQQLNLSNKKIAILNLSDQVLSFHAIKSAFSCLLKISNFLSQQKTDIVIANLPLAHFQMRLVKLYDQLRGKEYQLINYHHSLQYLASPLDSVPKKIFNSLNAMLARCTDDKSIFISKAVKQNICSHFYVTHQEAVIPNAIRQRNIDEKEGLRYLHQMGLDTRKTILLPGRIHPVKGHYFFLKAYAAFRKKYAEISQEYKILVAGGGAYHEEFQNKIVEYGLEEDVFVSGGLNNELLLSLFKCAYLVIIPSLYEGFGNVAIEGLMQQSIMLVSNAGGLDEIIEHGYNGFKFSANDQIDFQTKLLFVLNSTGQCLLNPKDLIFSFESTYTLPKQMESIIEFLRE